MLWQPWLRVRNIIGRIIISRSRARKLWSCSIFIVVLITFASVLQAEDNKQPVPIPTIEERTSLSGPSLGRYVDFVSFYEPTYILGGTWPAVEFQFSLKTRFLLYTNWGSYLFTNIYGAYTQRSFWDLAAASPYFYDTSYKPSGFIFLENIFRSGKDVPCHYDFQTGLEHESNGRGGTLERSMNTLYIQPTFRYDCNDKWEISFTPRAWVYVFGLNTNNSNMPKFHGYTDLLTTFSWKGEYWNWHDRIELSTLFRVGSEWDRGSVQIDLSGPFCPKTGIVPRFHAQLFSGYGQTLIQYNKYSFGLRAGISLFD